MSDLSGQEREALPPIRLVRKACADQGVIASPPVYRSILNAIAAYDELRANPHSFVPSGRDTDHGCRDCGCPDEHPVHEAALAAPSKAAIIGIGDVVNGVATNWLFEGGDEGVTVLSDGTQLAGGWSMEELRLIAAAAHPETRKLAEMMREDTERPDEVPQTAREMVDRIK